jgi:hypothetical protein
VYQPSASHALVRARKTARATVPLHIHGMATQRESQPVPFHPQPFTSHCCELVPAAVPETQVRGGVAITPRTGGPGLAGIGGARGGCTQGGGARVRRGLTQTRAERTGWNDRRDDLGVARG